MPNGTDTSTLPPDESRLFGLSIRAIITLLVVSASTAISIYGSIVPNVEVHEPLYSMTMVAVGFFFGQKITKP